jgi:hypothetical protein
VNPADRFIYQLSFVIYLISVESIKSALKTNPIINEPAGPHLGTLVSVIKRKRSEFEDRSSVATTWPSGA